MRPDRRLVEAMELFQRAETEAQKAAKLYELADAPKDAERMRRAIEGLQAAIAELEKLITCRCGHGPEMHVGAERGFCIGNGYECSCDDYQIATMEG